MTTDTDYCGQLQTADQLLNELVTALSQTRDERMLPLALKVVAQRQKWRKEGYL